MSKFILTVMATLTMGTLVLTGTETSPTLPVVAASSKPDSVVSSNGSILMESYNTRKNSEIVMALRESLAKQDSSRSHNRTVIVKAEAPKPKPKIQKKKKIVSSKKIATKRKPAAIKRVVKKKQVIVQRSSHGGVISIAASYTGIPYRYGGTTPSGFDCSGYTQFVFRQAGITLPRTSSAQYSASARISRSSARPGDLVFFLDGGHVYHVGIYAGGNMMYDSPRTGKSTSLRSMWTSSVSFGRP